MFPRAYDYYRQVPPHVLRGSHSTSLTGNTNAGSTPSGDVENGGLIECVICYNAVETDSGNYMVSMHTFNSHCSYHLSTDVILSIIMSIIDHTLRSPLPQTLFGAVAHHEDGVLHMQSSVTSYRGFLIHGTREFLPLLKMHKLDSKVKLVYKLTLYCIKCILRRNLLRSREHSKYEHIMASSLYQRVSESYKRRWSGEAGLLM